MEEFKLKANQMTDESWIPDVGVDAAPLSPDGLGRITALAQQLDEAARALAKAETDLKAAQAAHRRLERDALPELMTELGLREITLLDGNKVAVVQDFDCGVTQERNAMAMAWLEQHGFGGLIKTEVSIPFSRDQHAEAIEFAKKVRAEFGEQVQLKEGVHFQTLKAFIKEQRNKGESPPEDLFGIHPFAKAKLIAPKR